MQYEEKCDYLDGAVECADGVYRQRSERHGRNIARMKDNSETCVCGADNAWSDTDCWKCGDNI